MGFSDDFETFLFDEDDNSTANNSVRQQPSNIVENHNNSNLRRRTLSRPQHNNRQSVNNVQNLPQNNNFEQSLPQNTNNSSITNNSNSFNVDANEFEQFLKWKQAQNNNNKTNITTNNSNNGQSFNISNNYEGYYNSPQRALESDYINSVADNSENVTNSSNMPTITEYPKNLPDGHGPVVERVNHHTGKKVKIEGIPYERLPKSYQKMLDEQPTDEAGKLRIFVYSDGGRSVGSIIELGSSEAAKRLASKLDNSRRLLNKPSGISYNVRPSLDKIKQSR
jgi:hypothetical protein